MTVRSLPRSRLTHLVPTLCDAQALVALVPATSDARWAAEAAWDIARAAAVGGRRVALVDLGVEEPILHQVVNQNPEDGIVDAFEYGVSLSKVAREVSGVFFIPAGTYTARPHDVFTQPRWAKLQAGFRAEGALLLLYLSSVGLARLGAVPDGILVLAPSGFDEHFSPVAAGVQRAVERGATFLGVVRERWTPPPDGSPVPFASADTRPMGVPPLPATAPPARATPRASPGARRRWLPLVGGGLLVGAALFAPGAIGPRSEVSPAEPAASRPAAPPARGAAAAPATDSLPYLIQVAAFNTTDRALAAAADLAGDGERAVVSPIPAGESGTVWYRVFVGPYPSAEQAAAERRRLWSARRVRRGEGMVVRAPYSVDVSAADTAALRATGVLVFRLSARVWYGAFETPEQARLALSQLAGGGIAGSLVTRVGTTP